MKILSDGWLETARRVESPNCDERPLGTPISLLVIHNISLPPGQYGGNWIEDLFTNCLDCRAHPYFAQLEGLKVSSHLLIRRGGEIVQFVPFTRRAWHAGQSQFNGRSACNDYSIGIELEGSDHVAYERAQYGQLVDVTVALMNEYPGIFAENIVGHSDIAPQRKTDPGPAFDWVRYRVGLAKKLDKVADT